MPALPPKRVLVAPLDWGLGHAARCIPVIRALRDRGATVVIAGTGAHALLIREEFPSLEFVPIVNYGMTYAGAPLLLALKFPFMVARVMRQAGREHRELGSLIDRHRIDLVISDQRFGCWSRRVKCVYITHQLCVKIPRGFGLLERLVARTLRSAAERFDRVWIPDFPGDDNLTGDLTRKYPLPRNHAFIGPLSRFGTISTDAASEPVDLLVMLSGPEPQRSMFERIALSQLRGLEGRAVVLLGKPGASARQSGNIEIHPHLAPARIASLMRGARAIVCRAGYTTIMELVSLGRSAVLVPTPGQTEQEYLGARLAEKGWFACVKQNALDLRGIPAAKSADMHRSSRPDAMLLEHAIDDILR
jgi:uncharacterized protein (TIGR00661 family)